MPSIKKILYDHWLVSLGVLLAAFLGSAELTSLKLLSHYILPLFSTWYITTIIVLSLILIFTVTKLLRSRGPKIGILFPSKSPPRWKQEQTEQFIDAVRVKWKVWLGYDRLGEGSRVWVEGPHCPQCLYELDRDRAEKKWHCLKCNEYISIPKDLRKDTIQKMIKIFTANLDQLKRQKRNNLSSQP